MDPSNPSDSSSEPARPSGGFLQRTVSSEIDVSKAFSFAAFAAPIARNKTSNSGSSGSSASSNSSHTSNTSNVPNRSNTCEASSHFPSTSLRAPVPPPAPQSGPSAPEHDDAITSIDRLEKSSDTLLRRMKLPIPSVGASSMPSTHQVPDTTQIPTPDVHRTHTQASGFGKMQPPPQRPVTQEVDQPPQEKRRKHPVEVEGVVQVPTSGFEGLPQMRVQRKVPGQQQHRQGQQQGQQNGQQNGQQHPQQQLRRPPGIRNPQGQSGERRQKRKPQLRPIDRVREQSIIPNSSQEVINLDDDTVEVKTETEVAINEIDMVIADDFSNIQTTQTMRPARVAQRRDSGSEQQRRDRPVARNRTASVSLSRNQTPVAPAPSVSVMENHESNTGDIINRTMFELTSRNTVLEKALADAKLSLSAQLEATKKAEEKNTQLSNALESQTKKLTDVVGKQHQFQKFLTGMGNDYDILNRKNSEIKQQLKDALAEKEGIIQELEVMRGDLEKASAGAEVWGKYKDQVKEWRAENKRLLDRLRLLEGEFNQTTGLLVEERNRTQDLEIRIQEDRKLNMQIVETVTGVKEAIIGQLTELKMEMVNNMETGTGDKIESISQSLDTHIKTHQERIDAAMSKISESIDLLSIQSATGQKHLDVATTHISEGLATVIVNLKDDHEQLTTMISDSVQELMTEVKEGHQKLENSSADLSIDLKSHIETTNAALTSRLEAQNEEYFKFLASLQDDAKAYNQSFHLAMSEKLKECEARRQDSEAHRVTTETRCTELLEQISRYKASEDRLKLRIDTLEAELSTLARQPRKDNPELQQAIAGLNSKLIDFTKIQSEMKQVHGIELHNKEEYIKELTKQVQDLMDETESRTRSENAKFEAKQAEYEALLVVKDEMEAKINVLMEERAGFIAAMENERKEYEAKSLAYWKKQIQKLQETISGLERQKKGREKQLKDLEKHLGENDPQKLKIAAEVLSQENEDLKAKLETANSELKRMNEAVDTSAMTRNKEIAEAEDRLNQLAMENHRLQELATQIDSSRAQQNDNNVATYECQIQELTKNLEEHKKVEESHLALHKENSALREQLKNQKQMAEAREKVVKDQQDESRRLAGQIQVLQEATKELKQLDSTISTERKKNAESAKQLEISRQKVETLEKAIETREALERELGEANAKLTKEVADYKARESQVTKVKEDLEAQKSLVRKLTEVNAQLGKDLEVLRLHAKKDSETCLALEKRVAELTCELDKAKTEIQTLTESLNDALKETARAQTTLVNATNERDELKSKLFSLQRTAEELRVNLDDIKKGKVQTVQARIPYTPIPTTLRTPGTSDTIYQFDSSPPTFGSVRSTYFTKVIPDSQPLDVEDLLGDIDQVVEQRLAEEAKRMQAEAETIIVAGSSVKTPQKCPTTPRQTVQVKGEPPEPPNKKRKRTVQQEETPNRKSVPKEMPSVTKAKTTQLPAGVPQRALVYDGSDGRPQQDDASRKESSQRSTSAQQVKQTSQKQPVAPQKKARGKTVAGPKKTRGY